MTLVAAKQIYANYYFEAGLDTRGSRPRVRRLNLGRSANHGGRRTALSIRSAAERRVLNVRGRVTNGLRQNLVADLARIKRENEAAWTARRN